MSFSTKFSNSSPHSKRLGGTSEHRWPMNCSVLITVVPVTDVTNESSRSSSNRLTDHGSLESTKLVSISVWNISPSWCSMRWSQRKLTTLTFFESPKGRSGRRCHVEDREPVLGEGQADPCQETWEGRQPAQKLHSQAGETNRWREPSHPRGGAEVEE